MPIYQIDDLMAQIDPSAYVNEHAVIIGHDILKTNSSVWPFVTLRGDNACISIGVGSNVQDGTIGHSRRQGRASHH